MNTKNREFVCKNCFWKRLFSLFFILVLSLSLVSLSPVYGASADRYRSQLYCDFESCTPRYDYSNQLNNTNISYVDPTSRLMPVTGDQSIEGDVSLRINRGDIRWENLLIEDASFRISFTIKLDSTFNQTIKIKLSTQDSITDLNADQSLLLSISKNKAGDVEIIGTDGTVLGKLQYDETYAFEISFDRGSDMIHVKINDKAVSRDYHFTSNVFFVDGMCFLTEMTGNSQNGYYVLDGVDISTKTRKYQQLYSSQSIGTPVALRLPDSDGLNDFRVFVNGTQILITEYYISSQIVYISAEEFLNSISVPFVYDEEKHVLSIETDRVSVRCTVPEDHITINGTNVVLKNPVRAIDGVLMISPNFINEVFNAKVWWDQNTDVLVITTGNYKTDGVLRKIASKLYMNGEPYYTVGYNTLDLFQNMLSLYLNPKNNTSQDSWILDAKTLLSTLSQHEVRAIRVMCTTDLLPDLLYNDVSAEKYFDVMDALFDLCDQYNIKVVLCLDLLSTDFLAKVQIPGYGWILSDESVLDLVSNSTSKSWSILASFVEKFVDRYENRNTVLMYEVADCGNFYADTGHFNNQATYSLTQLANFYRKCTDLIRGVDSDRLIGSGDSVVLPYQWSLYINTMAGGAEYDTLERHYTTFDNETEIVSALMLLNESFDIISMKNPNDMAFDMNTYYLGDVNVQNPYYAYSFYAKVSEQLDKPFYNGAAGDEQLTGLSLQKAVANGLQLSFWDTMTMEDLLVNNRELVAKHAVNASAEENTDKVWGNSNVNIFDPAGVISIEDARNITNDWSALIYFIAIFVVMSLLVGMILFAFRNKKVV